MSLKNEKLLCDSAGKVDANGFWTTKARFARPGIQIYARSEFAGWPNSDKIQTPFARLLRPESVVFDTETMQSFANVPISVEHAAGFVTPDNAGYTVVGAAGSVVTREGDTLTIPVTLYERDAIEKAQSGERKELSAGAEGEIEYAPGSDEKYGDYDYVLKSWRGNHITLTKAGKAGPEFFIGDKQMTVEKKEESAEIKVVRTLDGINYAFTEQTSQIFDRVCGERDAARAEVTKLQGQILTDAKIDELVNSKMVERDNLAKVRAVYPTLDTAGKSADYIKALLDAAALQNPKKEEEKSDRAFIGEVKDAEKPAMTARENYIKNNSGRRN